MAGKKKAVNQAAKKAASDGKVTKQEGDKIQQLALNNGGNNAAVAIARAAANNQARIAEAVQESLGITQNKSLTRASTTQAPAGMDAYVSGFKTEKGPVVKGQQDVREVPVYTFAGRKAAAGDKKPAATDQTQAPVQDQPKEQDPMSPMVDQWGESFKSGMSELGSILQSQMEANAAQTELYMGMMADMMSQMTKASTTQQGGAYSVNTYQTPATGAQTTQPIAARKPVANDSLSFDSSPSLASGVGLNLAI